MDLNALRTQIGKAKLRAHKFVWRTRNKPKRKVAAFILGVQRSGTTILVSTLDKLPACEVYAESNPAAMRDFHIRDLETIQDLVERSRHEIVVFKPLKDSHLARELLDVWPNSRAVWMLRRVEDVAKSNYAKFGDDNLRLIRSHVAGEVNWFANGVSQESDAYLRSFDYDSMNPETACALLWYVRNRMYFDLDLQNRSDVLPVTYEDFVGSPSRTLRSICKFIGTDFQESIARDIARRRGSSVAVDIPEEVWTRCNVLYDEIVATRTKKPPGSLDAG